MEIITYNDFEKIEIKIGKIISAEKVLNSDKLIKLIFDIGAKKQQIIAGISAFKNPSELIGKEMPILVNIKPRKFRGIYSYGMILTVDVNGEPILLHPEKEVPPGSIVR
ncbi:MAG: methionine--tRNA ligase [Candidatus Aenigmarchaeota archaeon ex4484_52]|nr:MAG: methionine--tRNA ligase [Candidatus Aenigmarchaeota archaeon ex4484_52]